MHSFEVSLGYESVDRTTFSTLKQHAHSRLNNKNGYLTNQNNSIMYFEVNCKQKVIFIVLTTPQRVLYVHARRVLSIIPELGMTISGFADKKKKLIPTDRP
jgi:hypothetical protein